MESVYIGWIDWGIWMVYFMIAFLLMTFYKWTRTETYYRYFLIGFAIKAFGGIAYAYVFNYYYTFGDTFVYNKGAVLLAQTLMDDPVTYLQLLVSENGNLPPELYMFTERISYSRTAEEWFMVKLLSPITLISFQSYLVTTLFMSMISFWGAWKLFLVLRDLLPQKENLAFLAVFLVPSSLFWGSGIMKDTFTLAGINYIIYCLYFSVFKRKFSLPKYIGAMFMGYIVFALKGYIVLAFIPGFLFGINELIKVNITNVMIKRGLGFLLLMVTGIIIYIGPQLLREASAKYTVESIESRVRGFHSWHTDVGGSSYSLGEIEYTIPGVLKKVPAGLNVTLFRPYLWEVRNAAVLIGALESTLMIFLALLVLYKLGFKFMRYIRKQPMMYALLVYCLIFGFVVGFTSYNFGALGRYKIPMISIFAFILLYLNYYGTQYMIRKRYVSAPPSGRA
jgi:hypothetical protein